MALPIIMSTALIHVKAQSLKYYVLVMHTLPTEFSQVIYIQPHSHTTFA